MKLLQKLSFLIVCVVTVSGCTPQQRLQRLLTAHKELRYAKSTDTFTLTKTLYIDTTLAPLYDNYVVEVELDTILRDTCIEARHKTQDTKNRITKLFREKKCLEQPLIFADTIIYADKEVEIILPVTVVVTQEANAFSISVAGTGGKVLSNSKAFQVTALTKDDIVKYRKQGAWMVGGSLLTLLVLCACAYGGFKIYTGKLIG